MDSINGRVKMLKKKKKNENEWQISRNFVYVRYENIEIHGVYTYIIFRYIYPLNHCWCIIGGGAKIDRLGGGYRFLCCVNDTTVTDNTSCLYQFSRML